MKSVKDVMTRDVRVASPEDTIRDAAAAMAQSDVGSLPVGENDRLIGMITDRDIVVRATALGLGPETTVREVMSQEIKYCRSDESIDEVARQMAQLGVRRLPVIDEDKRLVGIVSLSNVSDGGDSQATETLLRGVATPH